ncbi:hypothetical protein LTR86_008279 [Recurvomyces mirabilis]|nr:hypothetical protein LTR86_008279 [Recurvomyces mirabilis]
MANQNAGVGVDTALVAAQFSSQTVVERFRCLKICPVPDAQSEKNSPSDGHSTRGLFAWPAEIRILLYNAIADTMIEFGRDCSDKNEDATGDLQDGSTGARHSSDLPHVSYRQPARPGFAPLQLVNLQFRHEFLAAWAESSVHHLHLPVEFFRWPHGHLEQRVPGTVKQVALQLSAGLQSWLEDVEARFYVAQRVRHVVLCTRLTSRMRVPPSKEMSRFVGQHVARHLQALPAGLTHHKIRVEVAILCVHAFDGSRPNGRIRCARRRFVLSLAPVIAEGSKPGDAAWVCTSESSIEERKISLSSTGKAAGYEWSKIDTEKPA